MAFGLGTTKLHYSAKVLCLTMCYFLYSGAFQSIVGWCEILGPLNAVMCQIPDIARGPTRYKIVVLYVQ